MTTLVAALSGCGGKPDECTQIKDRVRPVIAAKAAGSGVPVDHEMLELLLASICIDSTEAAREVRACVLGASSDEDTAMCLEPAYKRMRYERARHP